MKDALSIPWRLSTSQIPQRQTEGVRMPCLPFTLLLPFTLGEAAGEVARDVILEGWGSVGSYPKMAIKAAWLVSPRIR